MVAGCEHAAGAVAEMVAGAVAETATEAEARMNTGEAVCFGEVAAQLGVSSTITL